MIELMKHRKNTVERPRREGIIDIAKQYLIGILGVRGSGKSVLLETYLEKYFDTGYTVLDLWAAPNMENAFWIFAKEGYKKRIPITILAPESFIINEAQVDRFNGNYLTKEPLVEFVKLPNPSKKTDSEQNDKILEILTKTILECRDRRRILVFNPYMFPNEVNMFRTLEILMRNLITISYNHFHAIDPKTKRKEKFEDMTIQERTYHKMAFGIREFGEVAPARIKGDKSGESILIKKALLKFVRLARHANIDGMIDYQNASDVESAIRNQIDTWLIKKWTTNLAGENFDYIFDRVKKKRKRILDDGDWTDDAYEMADEIFPPIENLTYYWMYVKKANVPLYLEKVPELHIKHKEPNEKWELMTGIELKHDAKFVESSRGFTSTKASKSDEKALYFMVKELKSRKGKDKLNREQIIVECGKRQDNGDIDWVIPLKDIKPNTFTKLITRLKERFDSSEE